jgi:hypothetical protein
VCSKQEEPFHTNLCLHFSQDDPDESPGCFLPVVVYLALGFPLENSYTGVYAKLSGSSKKETEVGLVIQVSNATRPSSENVVH